MAFLFEDLNKKHDIAATFSLKNRITLINADIERVLKTIPDNSMKLIITSPPYNIGKEYETKKSISEYLAELKPVLSELIRVLREDGSLCWQVGNYVNDKEVYPLDIYFYPLFKESGLKLRNRIIWHFNHGLHASLRFSGRYETLLWFTKSDKYSFNLDSVRVPSKYPGKRHYKGPNKGKPSGNPLGKNPSDYWEITATDFDKLIWEIPNVKSNHPEKTVHPCQFPIELVERCVLAFANKGDFVFDPFCGVGSSLIAGLKHECKVVGVDKEEEYIKISKERINKFFKGELKIRPLGKPLHKPSGKEKVSQKPIEWNK